MDIPRARRIEAPSWVNSRTLVGATLFLLSFLGAQRILATPEQGALIWVAADRMTPGDVISMEDLTVERVDLPHAQAERYVAESTDLVGAQVLIPLQPGEFIPLAGVGRHVDPAASHRVTIPIEATHAVGGELRSGDRVDVYGTFETLRGSQRTVLIATEVLVQGSVSVGGLVGEGSSVGVTVAVSGEEAERIVNAIRRAQIDLVQRLSPARE